MNLQEVLTGLREEGFHLQSNQLTEHQCQAFIDALEQLGRTDPFEGTIRKKADVFAVRNLLNMESIVNLLKESSISDVIRQLLPEAMAVRGLMFDKPFKTNWFVPWHQDLTIAVKARHEFPGFVNWTSKTGVTHVQPPAEILARMLTLRIHLDNTMATNGALRIIPGSHAVGILRANQISQVTDRPVVCEIPRGGIMLMSPLLLHSSQATDTMDHRRVIHLEFSADKLPLPLEWQWSVNLA